jgi:hypothetical protein
MSHLSSVTKQPFKKCAGCGMDGAGFKHCGGCLSVFYCSSACQSTSWAGHEAACKQIWLLRIKVERETGGGGVGDLMPKPPPQPLRFEDWDIAKACCTTLRCNTLQCAAMRCNTLRCTVLRCNALGYNALHCTPLRSDALQCAALPCAAMRCNAMRCAALQCAAMRCNALQCAAMRCIAPYCANCIALHCNTPQ